MNFVRNPRVQFWLAFLFPVIAVLVAYAPIYNGPFMWDDETFLVEWPLIQDLKNTPQILAGALPEGHAGGYRPLRTLYEAVSIQLFHSNPTVYHIQAVVFHGIGTGLAFLIFIKLFALFHFPNSVQPQISNSKKKKNDVVLETTQSETDTQRIRVLFASLGAIVFGLHPVMQTSVAFIQANFDAMGITYAMISYYCFLIALENYSQKEFTKRTVTFLLISVFFSFVAFAFFELTYSLPLILFITGFLFLIQKNDHKESLFTGVKITIPIVIVLGGILFLRVFILNLLTSRPTASPGGWFTFLATTRAVFTYMVQTLFPFHLAAVHEIAPGITTIGSDTRLYPRLQITDPQTLLSLVGLLGIGFLCYKTYKKNPLIALGGLWFVIGLSPVLNIFVQGAIYSERYLYFSIVGFALVVVASIAHGLTYIKQSDVRVSVLVSFIILIASLYGIRTLIRVAEWSDPVYFWTKEANNLPKIGQIRNALGLSYTTKGMYEEALQEFYRAVELDPFDEYHLNNLIASLVRKKDYQEARTFAERAYLLHPNKLSIANLQEIYNKIDDPEHAVLFYSNLIETGKATSGIYLLHGSASQRLGHTATAEASLKKSIEMNPTAEQAYLHLASLYHTSGQFKEALEILEGAKNSGIETVSIVYNLALLYSKIDDIPRALNILDEARLKNPANAQLLQLQRNLEASASSKIIQ